MLEEEPPAHPNCQHVLLATSEEGIALERERGESDLAKQIREGQEGEARLNARTTEEAEQWAMKNIADTVDYSKMDVDVANLINKNLSELQAHGIRFGKIYPRDSKYDIFAVHVSKGFGSKIINFSYNPKYVKDMDAFNKTVQTMHSTGTVLNANVSGIITHELGHFIDDTSSTGMFGAVSGKLSAQWYNKFGDLTSRMAAETRLSKDIGFYIFQGGNSEFFAECFRLYRANELPSELAFSADFFKSLGW
jgi:hypothetical protein